MAALFFFILSSAAVDLEERIIAEHLRWLHTPPYTEDVWRHRQRCTPSSRSREINIEICCSCSSIHFKLLWHQPPPKKEKIQSNQIETMASCCFSSLYIWANNVQVASMGFWSSASDNWPICLYLQMANWPVTVGQINVGHSPESLL